MTARAAGANFGYQRWVDLAGDVLGGPPGSDLGLPTCGQLARDFRAPVAGRLKLDEQGVLGRPVGPPCGRPLNLEFYAARATDAPVIQESLELPDDFRARSSQEAEHSGGPSWPELRARLERDGIGHCLVFPLPGTPRGWYVVARSTEFTRAELDHARRVSRLVVGLARHAGGVEEGGGVLDPTPAHGQRRPVLSPRELAVLTLMAQGLIAQAIGHRLGVSPRTVSKHQQRIYRKFDTTDRLTTVLRAQAAGLVTA